MANSMGSVVSRLPNVELSGGTAKALPKLHLFQNASCAYRRLCAVRSNSMLSGVPLSCTLRRCPLASQPFFFIQYRLIRRALPLVAHGLPRDEGVRWRGCPAGCWIWVSGGSLAGL